MLATYKEALKVLDEQKLTAHDFHFDEVVYIDHHDGTQLFFRYAFLKEWRDWVFVFTEHHGYHIYHREDLRVYWQFKQQQATKLEGTGYKDKCEKCEKEFLTEELDYDYNYLKEKFSILCPTCNKEEEEEENDEILGI